MPTGQSTLFNDPIYFDASKNPFVPTYIGQCTWYCWSKAHSKAAGYPDRNLDVSRPCFKNCRVLHHFNKMAIAPM